MFAVQQYRDGNTLAFFYVCCPTANKSSNDEAEMCDFFGVYIKSALDQWF